ncbi:hypothetical protein FACS189472_09800 [Alphaproteobacteria bacterium]|nr:hypothetical protein FACS189472_09800 [Alphaproteobacteria bacterium]
MFGSEYFISGSMRNVIAIQPAPIQFPNFNGNEKFDLLGEFFTPLLTAIEGKEITAENLKDFVKAPFTERQVIPIPPIVVAAGGAKFAVFEPLRQAMSLKYLGKEDGSLNDSLKAMIDFAKEVRPLSAGLAQDDLQLSNITLYDQIAKFVGRMEIGGSIGTGTLVSWKGMPDHLVGRVVITCGHNRPGAFPKLNNVTPVLQADKKPSGMFFSQPEVYFTPDFDSKVWAAKRIPDSIAVEQFYNFTDTNWKQGSELLDFAVVILKEAVKMPNGSIVKGADLGHVICPDDEHPACTCLVEEGKYFNVGYGTVPNNDQQFATQGIGNFAGWGLKKAGRLIGSAGAGANTFPYLCHRFSVNATIGPSDSGSPLIEKIDGNRNRIVGIIYENYHCIPLIGQKRQDQECY